jgi:catechol 2,3-dioxygenase-like lactoylglutathione lyase family enzyme
MSAPLGVVVQLGYLVDDLEQAARAWARCRRAGPFLVRHHPPLASATHRGAPAAFEHSSAYGQWGALQVELVQVHEASPADVLAPGPGLHHVACFVSDLAAEQERLTALGQPEVLTAVTRSGTAFAFHDARADLGHLLEVYEPGPGVLGLYDLVAALARGWDGRDPVRSA